MTMAMGGRGGMTRKQRRLVLIALAGSVLAIAAGLVLYALSDKIVFFNSPSDVVAGHMPAGTRIRLGGMVADGSLVKSADGKVSFTVTDGNASVPVAFQGILPDLFREGQGVVTEGVLTGNGGLDADTVLAKHDERYMPKEVVDALKAQGRWEETAARSRRMRNVARRHQRPSPRGGGRIPRPSLRNDFRFAKIGLRYSPPQDGDDVRTRPLRSGSGARSGARPFNAAVLRGDDAATGG